MNLLHPISHCHIFQHGSRVDLDLTLPTNPSKSDINDLLEIFSEHPLFIEHISPVSTIIANQSVNGNNWSDMMVNGYKVLGKIFHNITGYVKQSLQDHFGERGMVPFLSFDIDPDSLHRRIQMDTEKGENTFIRFCDLFYSGIVSPTITVPFQPILPILPEDYDVRLLVRIGFNFFMPLCRSYMDFLQEVHKDDNFVVSFWIPEGGYNRRIGEIIYDEFERKCKEEEIKKYHLIFLLDCLQAKDADSDRVMKHWNILKLKDNQIVSVIFKNKIFSDWVATSNPSVKKLLDKTLAKVDADLNKIEIDYCWSHFETIESLTQSPKAAANFEQKISKFVELDYLSVAPDIFIRRKIAGLFRKANYEPLVVEIQENTAWSDWHEKLSLGRWEGTLNSNADFKIVDEHHSYDVNLKSGKIETKPGFQCWKIGFNKVRNHLAGIVKGDPRTYKGGVLEILYNLAPGKNDAHKKELVDDFLFKYSYLYWREYFLQHDYTEADLNAESLVEDVLCGNTRKNLSRLEILIALMCAQAYYFALDSYRCTATFWENLDQRNMYQNVMMLTLSIVYLIYIYHWTNHKQKIEFVLNEMKENLFKFENAYQKYSLADYGVTELEWNESLEPEIPNCDINLISRVSRRIATKHLLPLNIPGLDKKDLNLPTITGHIWNGETNNLNFRWKNRFYCGE